MRRLGIKIGATLTGVLALNLIFGAAGYLCFSRPKLRLVGQTYLAIFALMVPLTVAAAWVFLTLERRGSIVKQSKVESPGEAIRLSEALRKEFITSHHAA